ncbi:MAG: tRNA uridine(34) 5-carboxymethylaminomethyl modification radical SAM/GNAT enzyme Elp3 [Candidatus Altiarchaeota archaeon]|nr:tRNA uridine(34) 5-carboxymethylaminomethyl modification radical SAM/GNAT enzyme Elp3 [Candidatus Altiarchaeota archaeon]
MDKEQFYRKIIEKILSGDIKTRDELDLEKRKVSEELSLNRFIRSSDILKHAKPDERDALLKILQKKPSKTVSGVVVVAAMTQPSPCPHGKCRYCPGGPDINVPQSYTGKEPATRRAIRYFFDPFLQVTFRLAQLRDIGHPTDKVELIVMGGTLTAQDIDYQDWFVKECLRAMNEFETNHSLIGELGEAGFMKRFKGESKIFRYREDVQEANESSSVRCVGLTFEPRPDWARKPQIDWMLELGVTRVETGVQAPFDFVYGRVDRGHTVEDVAAATKEMKDSGLKVAYHMMPGILGYRPKLDLHGFRKIFTDSRFMPDMVKIYPCLVIKGTVYYDLWKNGIYEPMNTEEAVDLIVKATQMMPPWVRTMRIMRDIPSNLVEAGIKESNLGQLVDREMEKRGAVCSCIRCREVGHKAGKGIKPEEKDIKLVRRDYEANGGREIFLSFEDAERDVLIGFLRLRIPFRPFRPEIDDNTALVRELHVYGPMVEIGEKALENWQHRGYGKELLEEAERIAAEEFDKKRTLVTSGIGARNYYRKLGYDRCGAYMGKSFSAI